MPQRAVNELQGGYQVAGVGQDNRASIRPVTMGAKLGSWWVVDKGLNAGDRVAAEGIELCQSFATFQFAGTTRGAAFTANYGNRSRRELRVSRRAEDGF